MHIIYIVIYSSSPLCYRTLPMSFPDGIADAGGVPFTEGWPVVGRIKSYSVAG